MPWAVKWLALDTSGHERLEELQQEVESFCRDLYQDPVNGRLLLLCGRNGTGKTHCARAVHRWLNAVGAGRQFVAGPNHVKMLDHEFVHWPTIVGRMKDGAWHLADELIEATVLILDEVGNEHDPSKLAVEKLTRIFSMRERKWTLVTTNFATLAEWEARFDLRVASRFRRNSVIVDLSGVPDYSTR